MPYNRSLPAETLARLEAEIRLALPGADPQLRFSMEYVLARVVAMASYEMDGYIEYVMRQILPTTCDVEFLPLHGFFWSIPQLEAQRAVGPVEFSGTDSTVIPAGTAMLIDDLEFTLDADVTIASGTGEGTVTAELEGAAGNKSEGAELTLVSPIAGIQSAVTILTPGLSGGVDIENPEAWRARIVERVQTPPHGGNEADYHTWAKAVPGVSRVWVYPNQLGRGSVYLLFVMDEKPATIIPTPTEVGFVQDYIDIKRPVTADVTVAAPTPVEVDFEINLSPNTAAVRAAVTAELADLIRRESTPGGTLLLSHIREAISVATGETDHALVNPSANVTRTFGEISVVGDITFGAL
jgi:uncharacterized phage protein gp47/JayE